MVGQTFDVVDAFGCLDGEVAGGASTEVVNHGQVDEDVTRLQDVGQVGTGCLVQC